MEKWEIQRDINNLEWRKGELKSEISALEKKKNRIISEFEKKSRQQNQTSSFFLNRRQNANNLKAIAQGNAVNKMLDEYISIFDSVREECVIDDLSEVKSYLEKNCESIDEQISELNNQISTINWNLCQNKIELENKQNEVM